MVIIIVGVQWGDEGKGKIVDILAEKADIVARYQGGANAGHTVKVEDEEYILHQMPSGIFHPRPRCLIGNGVVLDPFAFLKEVEDLISRGIRAEGRIGISAKTHLLLEYHKRLDALGEKNRGGNKIGTTGRGIGPCYGDKVTRHGIRVGDLRLPAEKLSGKVYDVVKRANKLLLEAGELEIDAVGLIGELLRIREKLVPLITDVSFEIYEVLKQGKNVLLEGAQGTLLDIDHGTYPYVTSSNTTAGAAATGVGIGPTAIGRVLGVVKAYTTRVGEGPFPTELESPLGELLRKAGREFGATTGRPRRCGWFDALVLRYAARVNGLTGLVITKLDVLDEFEEIKLAVGYKLDGKVLKELPDDPAELSRVQPVYETLSGWKGKGNVAGATSVGQLPEEAAAYIRRIEELSGVPVKYISTGPGRHEIIVVRKK